MPRCKRRKTPRNGQRAHDGSRSPVTDSCDKGWREGAQIEGGDGEKRKKEKTARVRTRRPLEEHSQGKDPGTSHQAERWRVLKKVEGREVAKAKGKGKA